MIEHPILFNTEMVRAILYGRKTQTRRVIKPQPVCGVDSGCWWPNREAWQFSWRDDGVTHKECNIVEWFLENNKCPYQVGNRLWVRETWYPTNPDDKIAAYKADFKSQFELVDGWKPSIHMPRWASRITLEVTDIRVERVQDISEADATAEGTQLYIDSYGDSFYRCLAILTDHYHKTHFERMWDSINAKRGFGWGANPYVWVIEFKRVEGE